jgi:hypothetical protein
MNLYLLLAHSFANKKDHLLVFSLKLERVFFVDIMVAMGGINLYV